MLRIEWDLFAQVGPILPDDQGLLEHVLGGQLARPARIGIRQGRAPGRAGLLLHELLESCNRLAVTPAGQILLRLAFDGRGGEVRGCGFPAR